MSSPLSEESVKAALATANAVKELRDLKPPVAEASWPNVVPAVAACVAAALSFFGGQCGAQSENKDLKEKLDQATSASQDAKSAAVSANVQAAVVSTSLANMKDELNREYHALLQQMSKPEARPADRFAVLAGLCAADNLNPNMKQSARAIAMGYATTCGSACGGDDEQQQAETKAAATTKKSAVAKDPSCNDACDGFKALTQLPADWAESYSTDSGNQFDAVRGLCRDVRPPDILKQDQAAIEEWNKRADEWNKRADEWNKVEQEKKKKKQLKKYMAPSPPP